MAKEYGTLPSSLRALPAGDILYDMEVFGIGCEIDGKVNKLAADKNGRAKVMAYLQGLSNKAKAWREKRRRG
jgi:hypothetical protein